MEEVESARPFQLPIEKAKAQRGRLSFWDPQWGTTQRDIPGLQEHLCVSRLSMAGAPLLVPRDSACFLPAPSWLGTHYLPLGKLRIQKEGGLTPGHVVCLLLLFGRERITSGPSIFCHTLGKDWLSEPKWPPALSASSLLPYPRTHPISTSWRRGKDGA